MQKDMSYEMRDFLPRWFRRNVDIVKDGCWTWKGGEKAKGTTPRRASYSLHFGFIPKGKQVGTTCERMDCVAPAHLRLHSAS